MTELSCGHRLEAIIYRCPKSRSPPACFVISWDRYRLHDTCANCDFEVNKRLIQAEYEKRHAELMMQMRDARRNGRRSTVAALTRDVMALSEWQRASIRRVLRPRGTFDVDTSPKEVKLGRFW